MSLNQEGGLHTSRGGLFKRSEHNVRQKWAICSGRSGCSVTTSTNVLASGPTSKLHVTSLEKTIWGVAMLNGALAKKQRVCKNQV